MEIISWNIQAARGTDGLTDVGRVASVLREMGDPDLICVQEIGQHFVAPDRRGDDQVRRLADHFPEHGVFFGPAVDRLANDGAVRVRARFGNLILSRPPVLRATLYKLPQPADPEHKHMPRQATEVIVELGGRPCRVITTHLEYFSVRQRAAQADYLVQVCDEARHRARQRSPSVSDGDGAYSSDYETELTVLCGDFNLEPDSDEYRRLTAGDGGLLDAWRVAHGGRAHDPTCGVFDHQQWQDGAHCRDFFFLSRELGGRVAELAVKLDTDASDHQPVRLVLDES